MNGTMILVLPLYGCEWDYQALLQRENIVDNLLEKDEDQKVKGRPLNS